jgi:putative glutamine amidotransferase
MTRPIIAITPDYSLGGKEQYSYKPFYAVRQNYIDVIKKSGAIPFVISYEHDLIDDYLNLIDGIMFTGGDFDINPLFYNQEKHPETKLNSIRSDFEYELIKKITTQKPEMPIFGICNGMQLINVFYGGTCIQHIPDHKKYITHEQSKVKGYDPNIGHDNPYHDISIRQIKSQLSTIVGNIKTISTNSSHHQAVDNLGHDIISTATCSKDGIIEAIEHEKHPFCLGVQWHPEYETNDTDSKLLKSFVKNCNKFKKNNDKNR